ncbi:MAG: Late competence protein ComEA, DNA receptor [uncultured Blastococcus sp.]|uniref:Late competence protein ComEA, DNA receptor n=1 Tax=uncultured Blastococcus sp. TaxID=217144 RepID=A0A6J4I6L7_9ACTN|nr:MAG: Late competence protein ComEA, DNA receptor [uncultured Blastococcus sp.]
MRLPSRRSDDADVIRERLRRLLDERDRAGGWVPDDLDAADEPAADHGWAGDDGVTGPVPGAQVDTGLPSGFGRHRAPGREQRWDPGRHGARSLWIAGVLAGLLLVGWTWLQRPQVEPVEGAPASSSAPSTPPVGTVAETSAPVVVSVVGQVATPGLVSLPSGSRVADAVEAAGGFLPDADPASVNLAAPVADGEQVTVGLPGTPTGGADGGGVPGPSDGRVDLNRAGAAELDALPGIGPVLAQRIVDHREREGPFRSVEQLDDVPGIGPAIAAELAGLVTV